MQQIYIPTARVKKLKESGKELDRICKVCSCKTSIEGNNIILEGDSFGEYQLLGVIEAFGRGFSLLVAEKLLGGNYYFSSIDIRDQTRNRKRIDNIKARLIGTEGKTKQHIETETLARIVIYGDTVSFIGKIDEIYEAETAVKTIIEGGSHRLAYDRMAAAHRKMKEKRLELDGKY